MDLRPLLRRAARLGGAALVGLGGAWLAFLAFGRLNYQLGPFDVQYYLRPGPSVTEIALPPLGRIRADSHLSPLEFTATVQAVDPDRVTARLASADLDALVLGIEREALDALRGHLWRWLLIGAGGAAVSGLVVFRRRWRAAVAAAVGGVVLLGGFAGVAWATYRPSAFLQPTFTGSLRIAPRLIGPIRQATDRLSDFRAEIARLAEGALTAYGEVARQEAPSEDAVAILHISDIHASPLGMDFAQRLARAFRVNAVVDTGDITSFGTPLEETVLARIPQFRIPYIYVRGNHDSAATASRIDAYENAEVLEGEPIRVAGIKIYGDPHPLYTPDPSEDFSHEEIAAAVAAAGDELARELFLLAEPPDLLAVHDGRQAQASAGLVPVAVSGHFHEFDEAEEAGTLFLRVGTTGGGGLDVFTEAAPFPLAAQILYFEGEPPRLLAYDRIELDPTTRRLEVDRRLVGEAAEPVPGPSPSPGA
ncbi:MAG TPA: metallophosphoesterase family protein [Actinomycetota bacterium]|nr:metallophosphoesterase family protein [Actinomycetota bacterium]